ncbi:hypothetical protein C8R47DRAFT_1230022 [Mycena vitilis]|nr:hypothetical protein C8R47DRAFT_1230022 [Mycena vitilis]
MGFALLSLWVKRAFDVLFDVPGRHGLLSALLLFFFATVHEHASDPSPQFFSFAHNVGGIIGVAIGGVVALLIGVLVVFFLCGRLRFQRSRSAAPPAMRQVGGGALSGAAPGWRSPLADDDDSVHNENEVTNRTSGVGGWGGGTSVGHGAPTEGSGSGSGDGSSQGHTSVGHMPFAPSSSGGHMPFAQAGATLAGAGGLTVNTAASSHGHSSSSNDSHTLSTSSPSSSPAEYYPYSKQSSSGGGHGTTAPSSYSQHLHQLSPRSPSLRASPQPPASLSPNFQKDLPSSPSSFGFFGRMRGGRASSTSSSTGAPFSPSALPDPTREREAARRSSLLNPPAWYAENYGSSSGSGSGSGSTPGSGSGSGNASGSGSGSGSGGRRGVGGWYPPRAEPMPSPALSDMSAGEGEGGWLAAGGRGGRTGLLRPGLAVLLPQTHSTRSLGDHVDYSRPIGARLAQRMESAATFATVTSTASTEENYHGRNEDPPPLPLSSGKYIESTPPTIANEEQLDFTSHRTPPPHGRSPSTASRTLSQNSEDDELPTFYDASIAAAIPLPQTPSPPPFTPSRAVMELVPMFSGDLASQGSAKVSTNTFLKKFRAHMMDLIGNATMSAQQQDTMKIKAFENYLEDDSPAEKWFTALQTPDANTVVTTWDALEAAFKARFPAAEKAERTEQEWERELSKMRITLAELDTTVSEGGREVYAHVQHATRMLEIAQLAGIADTSSGIWQSRDALPDPLREKVPATHANWKSYTTAIKSVDRVGLRESVAKARKTQDLERTVADLKRGTPSAPLTPVSKMAGQLARTALVTPRPATAPAAARGGAGANPFGGAGGQGNLFAAPVAAPEMTDASKAHLRDIVMKLTGSMLQDDAVGRNEYARRITTFNAVHGTNKIWLERTGYPLSPGTSPPCTKECYLCGKVTIPWHRRADCPGPPIPRREATFRSLCAKYLEERAVAVNAVLGDLDWMDFVTQDPVEEDFGEGLSE